MEINEKLPLIYGVPGKKFIGNFPRSKAFVAELRPGLEGMKGTGMALLKKGAEPVIICDNMLAFCMQRGLVARVYIFYQSLGKKAAVCRTGSLIAALCAASHGIPVEAHRAAPLKKAAELLRICGQRVTSGRIKTYVPLTEEVPLEYITETHHA